MDDGIKQFSNGLRIHARHLSSPNQSTDAYEPALENVFRQLISGVPEGGCFVNFGASIGFYAFLAKRYSPRIRVHAFEPLALHREYFAENAQLNGFQSSDFVVYDEGVGRADGRVEFHQNRYGSMVLDKSKTSLKQWLKIARLKFRRCVQQLGLKDYQLQITTIPIVSLPTVVQRIGGTIDCLQMDIQGSELDALVGGAGCLESRAIKSLLISTHGAGLHAKCAKLLKSRGYTIELDQPRPKSDGTLVASFGGRRLTALEKSASRWAA